MAGRRREQLAIGHASRAFLWTTPQLPGWTILGHFRKQSGEWVIEELTIRPTGLDRDEPDSRWMPIPARGVTSELLRSVSIGRLRAAIAQHLADVARRIDDRSISGMDQLRPTDDDLRASARTSATRPVLSDAFLEEVAKAWLEEVFDGRRGAYRRMVDRFATRATSEETVKGWLVACRDRGWLEQNPGKSRGRGRLVAEPGARLLATGWRSPISTMKEQP